MIQRAGYQGVAADYDGHIVSAVLPALEKRAREILGEMGYGAGEIEKLAALGVIACYQS